MPPKNEHEKDRVVTNLIRTGTIHEHKSKEGKLLARVNIHGRISGWMPVVGISNKFIKVYIPLTVGEQVEVHSEFGNADAGVIHRSIFSDEMPEPAGANETTAIIQFHDGGEVQYDTSGGKMTLKAVSEAKITAPHIELDCETSRCTGDMDIDGSLNVGGDISTDGEVSDVRGDLTNFTTTDGAERA